MAVMQLLPLFKLLFVFGAMLAGIRLRMGLWPSIVGGSLLLMLLFGHGLADWMRVAGHALADKESLLLAGQVGCILVFSDLFEATGQSVRLMEKLACYLRRPRLKLIFFPALIGFLPMPGGADFSAPMLGAAARGMGLKPVPLALLNYWFRHMWEVIWPLYPALLLSASLTGLSLGAIILRNTPWVAAYIFLGWHFLLRPAALPLPMQQCSEQPPDAPGALREGLPLLAAIGGSILLEAAMALLIPAIPAELGIMAGLLAGIALCARANGLSAPATLGFFLKRRHAQMLLIIFAIFIFKDAMQDSGAITALAKAAGGKAALYTAAVPLPFLVGMIAGISMAFVGATMPLMLGLIDQLGLHQHLGAFVSLNLFSGFLGVMVSPLHICFILSCRYFNADMATTWRRIVPPCAALFLFTVAYALILFRL